MRSKDALSLGLGQLNSATFIADSTQSSSNPASGFSTVTVNMNNQSIEGDSNFSIPLGLPYGLMCLPADNTYAVTMNIQGTTLCPIVLTQIPAYANMYSISGLVKGESALYSLKYALQANLDGLHANLDNTNGQFTATLLWGENITKVLLDILTYLGSLSTWLTGFQTAFNTSTIPYSATIPSLTTLSTDKTDLLDGKGYINDTGAPM